MNDRNHGNGQQRTTDIGKFRGFLWAFCSDSGATPGLTCSDDGQTMIAEPSRAEPSRAEPSRAEPSRAEPSRAEPSRAEPSRPVCIFMASSPRAFSLSI